MPEATKGHPASTITKESAGKAKYVKINTMNSPQQTDSKSAKYPRPWRTGSKQRRNIATSPYSSRGHMSHLEQLREEFKELVAKTSQDTGSISIRDKARINAISNF